MIFDEETLLEIEDYIQALNEMQTLKSETIDDFKRAIDAQRKFLNS